MLTWFWCSKCERAFSKIMPAGAPVDLETGDLLEMPNKCMFENCPSGQIWLWWKHRAVNTAYPKTPLYGVWYPLYPTKQDYIRIHQVHEFVKSLP